MKRVLLAGVKHEANTFVPGLTTLENFRRRHLLEGQAVFGPERGRGQEIDGIVQVAEVEGIELIPTVAAQASPSGPVADSAYEFLRSRVVAGARAEDGRLDGVILSLHGAMLTEHSEDPEGELIAAVRDEIDTQGPTDSDLTRLPFRKIRRPLWPFDSELSTPW